MRSLGKTIATIIAGVLIFGLSAYGAEEYSFTVENSTKTTITKVLVSEDGKEWGFFDIGDGIKAGDTMTLVWDTSTNNQDCKQYVKAVWIDDSESESAIFNFCEKDLELVF